VLHGGQIRLNGHQVRQRANSMDYESIDDYRSHVKERLARIETILERELPDIKEQLKMSNGRTRKLENWRNFTLGGLAIIIFIITNIK